MSAEVHVGKVRPHKEWLFLSGMLFHIGDRAIGDVIVDGLHALFGQGTRVFDAAIRKGVKDATGAKVLPKVGIFFGSG